MSQVLDVTGQLGSRANGRNLLNDLRVQQERTSITQTPQTSPDTRTGLLGGKKQWNVTERQKIQEIAEEHRQKPGQQGTKAPSIVVTGSKTEPLANRPTPHASIVQELMQETRHFLCLKIDNKLIFVKAL